MSARFDWRWASRTVSWSRMPSLVIAPRDIARCLARAGRQPLQVTHPLPRAVDGDQRAFDFAERAEDGVLVGRLGGVDLRLGELDPRLATPGVEQRPVDGRTGEVVAAGVVRRVAVEQVAEFPALPARRCRPGPPAGTAQPSPRPPAPSPPPAVARRTGCPGGGGAGRTGSRPRPARGRGDRAPAAPARRSAPSAPAPGAWRGRGCTAGLACWSGGIWAAVDSTSVRARSTSRSDASPFRLLSSVTASVCRCSSRCAGRFEALAAFRGVRGMPAPSPPPPSARRRAGRRRWPARSPWPLPRRGGSRRTRPPPRRHRSRPGTGCPPGSGPGSRRPHRCRGIEGPRRRRRPADRAATARPAAPPAPRGARASATATP